MSDKSGRKKLLVFAHRGEAKVFIKRGHFQPVGFLFNGLYEREGELLLISGEGVQSTTERLSAVCAAYAKEIETVINMGIAGSLTQNTAEGETEPIELNGIYSVRTVYGDNGSDIAFRTFTSDDPNARIDCISANNRVLEDDDAQRLSWFAQLVDRELWACGSVCALFKLPFCSYKLVSDVAGQGTDCIDISHRAGEFSRRLYQFYGELTAQKKRVAKAENHEWQLPDAFYATTTQRRQLASLLKNLTVKYQTNEAGIQERINLKQIISTESNPKQRTTVLIDHLKSLLNPFNAGLKAELDRLCKPLKEAGCKIHFARDYEDDAMDLSVKLKHSAHKEKLQKALTEFQYQDVLQILNGEKKLYQEEGN